MLKMAALLLLATPALAQTEATPTKVKYYKFGELDIEAGPAKVPMIYMSARGKQKWERIVRLKHSVLPKMKATAKDVTLR
jgi:hypothetical protein